LLHGRAIECARIQEILGLARQGRSGAVIIRAEAGLGKTALVDYAVSEAAGLQVMTATAAAGESRLPFACLHRLLAPRATLAQEMTPIQRDALLGALALGPPPRSEDRFAVSVAVLSMLGVIANSGPALIAIDDVQWLDQPTAETFGFVIRRLGAEGIAVILASRDEGMPPELSDLPVMRPGCLTAAAATGLLTERLPTDAEAGLAQRLATASGGNPLVAVEMVAQLSAGQLAGREPIDELILAARTGPARLLARRLDSAPATVRTAAILAAVADPDELPAVLAAARTQNIGATAIEDLEDRGVLSLDRGTVRFLHPVMRAAIVESAAPRELRAAHRSLAGTAGPEDQNRRAWHLAAAALEPDEEVAQLLEAAAHAANARGGFAAAAAALVRSAELTAKAASRPRRRFAAAQAARMAGQNDMARTCLEQMRGDPHQSPALRAAAAASRGRLELRAGRLVTALAVLSEAASTVGAADSVAAAGLLADAAMISFLAGEPIPAVELAAKADELGRPSGGNTGLLVQLIMGTAHMHLGELTEGLRMVRDAARIAGLPQDQRPDLEYVIFTALGLVWIGDHVGAQHLLTPIVAELRAGGGLGELPFALYAMAYTQAHAGRLGAAVAAASEAVELATATGDELWRYLGLGGLALAHAQLGDEAACRRDAQDAIVMRQRFDLDYPRDAQDALGLLELSLGHADRAIDYLEPANELRGLGPVLARPSATDLIEAYVRAGRAIPDGMASGLIRQSHDEEFPQNAAIAWRCRGLMASNSDYYDCFQRALSLHDRGSSPFETARTQFCFGERMRRTGHRAESRGYLRSAEMTFIQIGAHLWTLRTQQELRATGESLGKSVPADPAAVLTPQESAVASAIAQGATNREAATALFLSPKTIEMHLSRVYRKLGLRSRTDLVRWSTGLEHGAP
jgi:DNA-binding CsgD family transcriptional regulator